MSATTFMTRNRKERRALARMTPEKARQIATESYDKYRADMLAEVYGQFMSMFLLYLHNELHFGEYRIHKAFVDFDDLIRAVRRKNYLHGIAEVRQILKDDCKFDIQAEYKKLIEQKGEYE